MAKYSNPLFQDAALDYLAGSTRLVVCSAQPANFAGIAAVALADNVISGASFTKVNGDVSGRKSTVAQQASVPIDASGTATHISLDDGVNLRYVTTCTSQALTIGGTVTVPAWDVEVASPT